MFVDYLLVARANPRPLLFGAILLMLSSAGQTFFVALTGAEMRAAFAVSDGTLGASFAAATLASGLVLSWVGRWLDHVNLRLYAAAVTFGLVLACVAVALAPSIAVLTAAFFLLRLTGQGLMVHTALTATARRFPRDRGKALGLVALGLALGEACLPPLVVAALRTISWRGVWWVAAATVLVVGFAALLLVAREAPSGVGSRHLAAGRLSEPVTKAPAARPLTSPWADRRFVLSLPAVLAPSFVVTGFFFHQARLATELGWGLETIAAGFVAFAVVRAAALLGIGPVIDRIGAARVLPWFLLPLALAMTAIMAGQDRPGFALAYLVAAGLTGGVATTMITALWTEFFGLTRLASVRALVAAMGVAASALAPVVMGALIDLGVGLRMQAAGCLVGVLAAAALTIPVARQAPSTI